MELGWPSLIEQLISLFASFLPVALWFFMGLMTGLIIAIAGLKLAPQGVAEAIRPDLVEKGKSLVIIDGQRQGDNKKSD